MAPLDEVLRNRIVVAPMAGGPSTPALVTAAAEAGALAFVAAGYRMTRLMRAEIDAVATALEASGAPFGVNVFVPQPSTSRPEVVAAYVRTLTPEAHRLGEVPGEPLWDADDWDAKVADLIARPVPW